MKFVCIKCEEAMLINSVNGDTDGSAGITFKCPSCGSGALMLINPMEAQLVKGMGVHVGLGSAMAQRAPMEAVEGALKKSGDDEPVIWDKQAEERLMRVPDIARPMAKMAIERHARKTGARIISTELMDEVKKSM
ncbi:MAG: PCP reductase family protein [Nitrospinae bacterium]|nr:PCP reductase family protein [Nitrospinota bacterium]